MTVRYLCPLCERGKHIAGKEALHRIRHIIVNNFLRWSLFATVGLTEGANCRLPRVPRIGGTVAGAAVRPGRETRRPRGAAGDSGLPDAHRANEHAPVTGPVDIGAAGIGEIRNEIHRLMWHSLNGGQNILAVNEES